MDHVKDNMILVPQLLTVLSKSSDNIDISLASRSVSNSFNIRWKDHL